LSLSGFSDPYCMLGIVSSAAQRDAGDIEGDRSGAGMKWSGAGIKSSGAGIKTAVDRIPARFIKTTSVKENTLNPVWNEKFCL